jgi:hypothetical protein
MKKQVTIFGCLLIFLIKPCLFELLATFRLLDFELFKSQTTLIMVVYKVYLTSSILAQRHRHLRMSWRACWNLIIYLIVALDWEFKWLFNFIARGLKCESMKGLKVIVYFTLLWIWSEYVLSATWNLFSQVPVLLHLCVISSLVLISPPLCHFIFGPYFKLLYVLYLYLYIKR